MNSQCSFVIKGKIIDLDDGKELDGTIVTLKEKESNYITDNHGRFKIDSLCEGNYTLLIQHLGCKDTVVKLSLSQNINLSIKLPHSAVELAEIDIMDKRLEMTKTQTADEIKGKELDKTRGQTLGEALKTVSGVTTLNTGSTISKPMIHGLQGYRILLINNGVRHEGQQWGNEHAPEIDPFIANKLTVIKGANSVRYGSDALGGVILIEPNDLADTASVTGEVNMIGANNGQAGTGSAILQGYFDKTKGFNWRLQGTYKKSGNVKTPEYYLKNTGVEEYNFSYALGYHRKKIGAEVYYSQFNTKVGIFSGAHIGNLTDLKNAFASNKPQDSLATFSYDIDRPYQQIVHELIKGKVHYHFAPKWRLLAQYAYQYNARGEYDKHKPLNDSLAALNLPELDYRISSQTGEFILEHDNIKRFRGQFGGSYMHQENVYLGRFFIPNFINNTWGVFGTERFVSQHLELEAGVRYDEKTLQSFFYEGKNLVKPFLKFSNISWNAGTIYKPNSWFNVFLNVGSAWRSPAPNELYSNGIHHGVGAIERGNKMLKVENVYNTTLTGVLKLKNVSAELTVYNNEFKNFIYLNPASQPELTIKGAYPVFNYKQADVRISGADLKASVDLFNHVNLTAKAMWLRAWNHTINDYLVYMPSDRYTIEGKFHFNAGKHLDDNYIQINYQYVTKQWRVPDSTDFAPPPPAYGLLGFEIGSDIKFGKQHINVAFAANNLLDVAYRDYLDRFRYYCDSPGRNFILRLKIPLIIYDKK